MKRVYFILISALITSIGCTEKFNEICPAKIQTFDYSFEASSMDDSKQETRLDFDAETKKFSWTKGDKTLLTYLGNGEISKMLDVNGNVIPFIASNSGFYSHFTATGCTNAFKSQKPYDYKVIFPFPAQASRVNGPIPYTIPSEQTAAFNPSYCLMYDHVKAQTAFVPGNGQNPTAGPDFSFKHLLTYLSVSIMDPDKMAPEGGFEILGFDITFREGKPIAGDITIDPTTYDDGVLVKNVNTTNKIKVKFAHPIPPVETYKQETSGIVACLPFQLEPGEAFNITVFGRTDKFTDIRQTVVCSLPKGMTCAAGHFRKINICLNDDFEIDNVVKPSTGTTIQDMIDTEVLTIIADKKNIDKTYGSRLSQSFKKVAKTMTAASCVINEGKDNVIILDNTLDSPNGISGTQSAFYMPIETVLPTFWDPTYLKDYKLTFKAYILFCGKYGQKQDLPLLIANNHCDESTNKTPDNGFNLIRKMELPAANVHYSPNDAPNDYPPVEDNPGWVEYSIDLPYKDLQLYYFMDKNNKTPAHIGFKLDNPSLNVPRATVYIKDIEFHEVNCRKINAWMSKVPDNTLVSDLSMPGTHDAAAWTINEQNLKCQLLPLINQLKEGVRVLDLRPSATPDLMINHGLTSTEITLEWAIDYVEKFLKNNPTETVVITVKNENGQDSDWAVYMKDYLDKKRNYEITPSKKLYADFRPDLKLGDVRGQIILLSRNDYNGPLVGGKIIQWKDSTHKGKTTITNADNEVANLWVQDDYKSSVRWGEKLGYVKDYIGYARSKAPEIWLFNYLTVRAGIGYKKTPKDYAAILNRDTYEYLSKNPGKTGVIFMDYAGDNEVFGDKLVQLIIDQNF